MTKGIRSSIQPVSLARIASRPRLAEPLEPRLLLAVNSWATAVDGNWSDVSKWSLGHVPTLDEPVSITEPGSYTVTLDVVTTVKALYVGGTDGTQTLAFAATNAGLTVTRSTTLGAGDVIAAGAGNFQTSGDLRAAGTVTGSGTINMGGTCGGGGEMIFAEGGTLVGGTIASDFTVRGGSFFIDGLNANFGNIISEGESKALNLNNVVSNAGTIRAIKGSNLVVDGDIVLTNESTGILAVSGGGQGLSLVVKIHNFGTIFARQASINVLNFLDNPGLLTFDHGLNVSECTIDFHNQSVTVSGAENGILLNGELSNISELSFTNGAKIDVSVGRSHGLPEIDAGLRNVTLVSDVDVAGPLKLDNVTLAGSTITVQGTTHGLNGTFAAGLLLTHILGGTGKIVLQGSGRPVDIPATIQPFPLNTTPSTIGAGITIRGGYSQVFGIVRDDGVDTTLTNFGTIIADIPSQPLVVKNMVNRGGLVSAPGTIELDNVTPGAGASMTVAIGGDIAGVNSGVFDWRGATVTPQLSGTLNVVLLDTATPITSGTFRVALFPSVTGAFAETNLDAGVTTRFSLAAQATELDVTATAHAIGFADLFPNSAFVHGTPDDDVISATRAGGVSTITLNEESFVVYSPTDYTVFATANDGDDSITLEGVRGTSVFGDAGNDTLVGSSGDDLFFGGDGNDSLVGAAGSDRMSGDAGDDTIFGGTGSDTLFGGDGNDLLHGARGKDSVGGDDGFDTLFGNAGDDTLQGGTGADLLYGGNDEAGVAGGNNVLRGGNGQDTLFGGDGNNTLTGGAGRDILNGGAGGANSFFAQDGQPDTLTGTAGATALLIDVGVDVVV